MFALIPPRGASLHSSAPDLQGLKTALTGEKAIEIDRLRKEGDRLANIFRETESLTSTLLPAFAL